MKPLNISKVAVGCASLETLRNRQAARVYDGVVPVYTRFRPKRAGELIGGSLYWILQHRLMARQTILSFGEDQDSDKIVICLDPELVRVRAQPRRAHQGWRYLDGGDAPDDLHSAREAEDALPPDLACALARLALL